MAEQLKRAGDVAREALKLAVDISHEGVPLIEIAERVEEFIRSRGALPAFPVNLSINQVAAHYTPSSNDELRVPKGSVLKIDVGVHVDGYIADCAVTVVQSGEYRRLALAAFEALKSAALALKPRSTAYDVGKVVEGAIRKHGYKPIENLTGHKIERYNLHAGKSIPNVARYEYRLVGINIGEVYAVEPFATNGVGQVIDSGWSNIYRVVSVKRISREKDLNDVLEALWKEFKGLPFAERWVSRMGFSEKELRGLVESKRVYHYPRLVEAGGGLVSQFEDTFIVDQDSAKPIVGVIESFAELVV